MKRIVGWICIVALLSAVVVGCAACGETPSQTQTTQVSAAQQTVNSAVDECAMPDYRFRYADGDEAVLATATGKADDYLIADDGTQQSLVYVYHDICYDDTRSYRYFEAYMPTSADKLAPDTPVFLYLHGGGWMAGNRHAEATTLMPYLAKAGQVVISMEYALWFGLNQTENVDKGVYNWEDINPDLIYSAVTKNTHPVSVFDMLDDVTACLTYLKTTYLPSLGLTAANIGMGGYSAGGHLSSLYAYKYADKSPIPIAFLLDLVGPVQLKDPNYLHLFDVVTGRAVDEDGEVDQSFSMLLPTVRKAAPALAGILGADDPIDVTTDEGYAKAMELIDEVQSLNYLTADSVPTIICYASMHDEGSPMEAFWECDFDNLVPITVYEAISAKLKAVGIVYSEVLFDNLTHNTAGTSVQSNKWMAQHVAAYSRVYSK